MSNHPAGRGFFRRTVSMLALAALSVFLPGMIPAGNAEDIGPYPVSKDYSALWSHHWTRIGEPETYLDITPNPDGSVSIRAHFDQVLDTVLTAEFADYRYASFDDGGRGELDGYLSLLPYTGAVMELSIREGSGAKEPGSSTHDYFSGYFYFMTQDATDVRPYFGERPVDQTPESLDLVIPLSEKDGSELFGFLSQYPLMAASGVGAWEGRIHVGADGSFTGSYYDEDADVIYECVFSGVLQPSEMYGNIYELWVDQVTTRDVPGTVGVSEDGIPIQYVDAPMDERSHMFLTLPSTPKFLLSETVMDEIGGLYGERDDYSRFITLFMYDGWGFFMDPTLPPVSESMVMPEAAEKVPVTETPAAEAPAGSDLTAWTGYWKSRDGKLAELIITDAGDGTLRARAVFLPLLWSEDLTLELRTDGMHFEDDNLNLSGTLIREGDGLRMAVTGGDTVENDEATEYRGYFIDGFVFDRAAYEEMWFQTDADAAGSEDDWLGTWISGSGTGRRLEISRKNGKMTVTFYPDGGSKNGVSSILEPYGDSRMDVENESFFNCILELNRKLRKIVMVDAFLGDEPLNGTWGWDAVIFDAAESSAETPASGQKDVSLLPVPERKDVLQVPVARVDATSWIVGRDPTAYAPQRLIDGEETTAFQFSRKTTPTGKEYLYFDFDAPVTVDQLWIKNGFWKITDGWEQYYRNCRVKGMTVYVRNSADEKYRKIGKFTLKDDGWNNGWKVLDLDGASDVTRVRIRIDSVYPGTEFKNDVCISEIMFAQKVR